jgi:uncharacterized SAM-binding protein YcdF (DUF218 family)
MELRALEWVRSLTPNRLIKVRKRQLVAILFLICLLGVYGRFRQPAPKPQAIFVLGGDEVRERLAAKLARQYPHLPIWVSSGSPEGYVTKIFTRAGISRTRLHLDYRASDTVTNFTTLADELKARGIHRVYLITSADHMRRACIVGEIVFGSRGIAIDPVTAESSTSVETWHKSLRDGARAIVWVLTGYSGDRFSLHNFSRSLNSAKFVPQNRELISNHLKLGLPNVDSYPHKKDYYSSPP